MGGKKTDCRSERSKSVRKHRSRRSRSQSSNDICAKFLGKGAASKPSCSAKKGKFSQKVVQKGKCHKEGPITRNPFFNFLRDYRKKHCGWTVVQIAREGAKEWRRMSEQQKQQYKNSACKAPKIKRRRRSKRRSGSRCSSRRSSSSRCSSKSKSSRSSICKSFSGPC
ncbi:hypothetical protein Trydic_g13580 [Trypoxylus dichotomus]